MTIVKESRKFKLAHPKKKNRKKMKNKNKKKKKKKEKASKLNISNDQEFNKVCMCVELRRLTDICTMSCTNLCLN